MNVLSFFTGSMGLDIGMEKHGFHTIIAVEQDKHAQQTIKINKPNITIFPDIFTITKNEMLSKGHVDVIIGGPPCQSWSSAGKHGGLEDHRGLCIPKFLDTIDMIQPQAVIMENVMGLTTAEIDGVKGAMPTYILQRLSASGYQTTYEIVNSADFGSPQIRKRVIFIATKTKLPMLNPTHALMQQLTQRFGR